MATHSSEPHRCGEASDPSADQLDAAIAEIEQGIKARDPQIRRVAVEAQSWTAHGADRVYAAHGDV
jgi:hypothetical protein